MENRNIDGRECYGVTLPNCGAIVWFITKFKGREYRLVKSRTNRILKMDFNVQDAKKKTQVEQTMSADFEEYENVKWSTIDIFVKEIVAKNGKLVSPNMDWVDELEVEDVEVFDKELSKIFESVKKN